MQKKESKSMKTVLSNILNIFFYLVIIVLFVFSLANIQVKRNDDIPNIFGIGFYSVLSDSMEGNNPDSFNQGDLIFVTMADDKMRENLQIGDVVTYFDYNIRALNTHRIIEFGRIDGLDIVITKGDNPITPNGNPAGPDQPILLSDVKAIHQSTLSGWGSALVTLQSPTGFAAFVILPVFLILIYQAVILGKNYLNLNKSKLEEQLAIEKHHAMLDLEAQKERMRQELLEELKKENTKS